MSNNRDRGSVGNTGAKTSATNTSGSLSETNQSHPEVLRSSSSSAALVNANNTENSNKYNYYQMQHNNQKSTGTSSITSDSITGITKTWQKYLYSRERNIKDNENITSFSR